MQANAVKPALGEASTLIADAVAVDKVDIFLHHADTQTLIAAGTSDTPMGHREIALGLDRLPIANGGRAVEVFQTGRTFVHGRVDTDLEELRGIREALGVRSSLLAPLEVAGTRRGVVLASSAQPEAFASGDRSFMQAVANWVGLILQRAELVERITREASEEARRLAAEELVTILAHDLRNYLAPLAGRVHILRTRAERERRTQDVQEADSIAMGLQRLHHFVAEMLDVARIERGILATARETVNLAELVHEVAATMETQEFPITVQAPERLSVTVDPARIRQALVNLLANVRHHAPGSPATVEVQPHGVPGENVVAVRDRGPGIAAHLLPQLMDRFVGSRRGKGLGIGLYLARGIAEAHGGRLEVESVIGQGTIFRMVLPAAPSP